MDWIKTLVPLSYDSFRAIALFRCGLRLQRVVAAILDRISKKLYGKHDSNLLDNSKCNSTIRFQDYPFCYVPSFNGVHKYLDDFLKESNDFGARNFKRSAASTC